VLRFPIAHSNQSYPVLSCEFQHPSHANSKSPLVSLLWIYDGLTLLPFDGYFLFSHLETFIHAALSWWVSVLCGHHTMLDISDARVGHRSLNTWVTTSTRGFEVVILWLPDYYLCVFLIAVVGLPKYFCMCTFLRRIAEPETPNVHAYWLDWP